MHCFQGVAKIFGLLFLWAKASLEEAGLDRYGCFEGRSKYGVHALTLK